MHELTAKRIVIDSHVSVSPEPPINGCGSDNARGSYDIRSMSDERLLPFGRRGKSRSWLPGTLDDPF